MSNNQIDSGTAYGFKPGKHNQDLTEVGAGTPMGELMRRYWQPIGLSSYASDLPREVRVLGEDLILFRDKRGRPGLVYPRCAHRGTSLLYGRVDDEGIRCCYHGWMFDVQGRCVDQPCEPNNGTRRDKVRQPWYPVADHYGLIWAYLGPAEKKPLLPRYDIFENLPDNERLYTDDRNIGSGAPNAHGSAAIPFNWLQHYENIHDAAHFLWLHYFHSGPQFGPRFGEFDKLDFKPWKWLETQQWRTSERGVTGVQPTVLPDGRKLDILVETILPGARVVPNPWGKPGKVDTIGFMLPVDDTHFRIFTVYRGTDNAFFDHFTKFKEAEAKRVAETPDYWQKFPNDLQAQGGQGPISLHSEEHLATCDVGIIMLRRLFQKQLDIIKAGGNPINTAFEPGKDVIVTEAGNFLSGEAKTVA